MVVFKNSEVKKSLGITIYYHYLYKWDVDYIIQGLPRIIKSLLTT